MIQGIQPRLSPTAKERTVMVRMPGALHARLCDQRVQSGKSINQICVDALNAYLGLPIVSSETVDAEVATETVADYPGAARVDLEAGTYDFEGKDDTNAF